MFLPLLHEAFFFLGIFGVPTLFFVLLARSGRRTILLNLGVLLLFIGFVFLNGMSWRFALLYLILGGLGIAHAGYDWPRRDYGLSWTGLPSALLGMAGGMGFALLFLLVTGSLGSRLAALTSHLAFIPLLATLLASLIPGIWEEFVFRGVIQGELKNLLRSPQLTVAVVAAVFTLFHSDRLQRFGHLGMGWLYLGFIFTGACFMGWLREGYGLLPAMLCHTLYNFVV